MFIEQEHIPPRYPLSQTQQKQKSYRADETAPEFAAYSHYKEVVELLKIQGAKE